MEHGKKSEYSLLPSFLASTLSVLNPRNNNLTSFGHAISFTLYQQIRAVVEFIQQVIIDIVNMSWTK